MWGNGMPRFLTPSPKRNWVRTHPRRIMSQLVSQSGATTKALAGTILGTAALEKLNVIQLLKKFPGF
jgi:hypothetical protein